MKTDKNIKVITAKNSGFCFGVKRAVNLAEKAVELGSNTYTLGPIIHNPQEVNRLEKKGIKILNNINGIKTGRIILRTHGIPLKTYKKLNKKKNITILDAVCPFVKKAQNIVKKLNEDKLVEGKSILIIGEKKHPEIAALVSYSTKCVLVENVKEAKKFVSASKIINIVSQTTQTQENFGSIVKVLKKRYKVEVHNTICRATLDRQSSAAKLSKQVDLMIVIGGKNSGNTARLTQICSQNAKTIHIETEEDLKFSQLKNMNKIGITAGASTPNWIIKGVKRRIKEFMKVQLC